MKHASNTQDGPARKALVMNPGKATPEAGQLKPSAPEAKKRQTGGGQMLKTPAEMAVMLGFSKRTLARLTEAKVIPVIRVGRLLFYRPEAVMAALQRNCEQKEVEA